MNRIKFETVEDLRKFVKETKDIEKLRDIAISYLDLVEERFIELIKAF